MAGNFRVMFLCAIVVINLLNATVLADEKSVLLTEIAKSHALVKKFLQNEIAVDVDLANIYAVKTNKVSQPYEKVRHVIKRENALLISQKETIGCNANYSFKLGKDVAGKTNLQALDARTNKDVRMKKFEESRRGILLDSIRFFDIEIVELFVLPGATVKTIEKDSAHVLVNLTFHPPGKVRYENVLLELDPKNFYQLVSKRDSMIVIASGERFEHVDSYKYDDETFGANELHLLRRVDSITKYKNKKGDLDEDHQTLTLSNWSQVVPDDSLFRLTGYNLPEPNLGALYGTYGWVRWALIGIVGSLGLVLLLFGKRLYRVFG